MRLRKNGVISSAVAAAMVLSLAACGGTAQPAATTAAQAETTAAQAAESAEEKAESTETKAESAEAKAEESTGAKETEAAAQEEKHVGMKLEIPAEYRDLLVTQTYPDDPEKAAGPVTVRAAADGKAYSRAELTQLTYYAKSGIYETSNKLAWLYSLNGNTGAE